MAIACGGCKLELPWYLVPSQFLDLFDGRPGHRQPGAEGMPVGVPDVLFDPCLSQARDEPGASVKPVFLPFPGEHRIRRLLTRRRIDSIAWIDSALRWMVRPSIILRLLFVRGVRAMRRSRCTILQVRLYCSLRRAPA
jgi:hypothetical protein